MTPAVARSLAASLLLIVAQPGHAAPVRDGHWTALAARLFPILSTQGESTLSAKTSEPVAAMLANRRQRIARCASNAQCIVNAALWLATERDVLAKSITLRASSRGIDEDIAGKVRREIDGLNSILEVYGVGKLPRYPLVDGPNEAVRSAQFLTRVGDAVALGVAGYEDPATALDPSVGVALALLDANDDEQATAFEPLDQRYNGPSVTLARTVDWTKYRFTAIIVPGIGPDDLATPLSPRGKLNVRMAADRFAAGAAPFIIVSGGAVHPRGTKYVEAVEMRRALIDRFSIPPDRIVIEPYARHTTTNLRNATRRLLALGAPLDRDALIVTNTEQSAYISSPTFHARNQVELGYQPGTVGARLSPNDVSFRPSGRSVQVDPSDPLDP